MYRYGEYNKTLCEKQFPCVKYACFVNVHVNQKHDDDDDLVSHIASEVYSSSTGPTIYSLRDSDLHLFLI